MRFITALLATQLGCFAATFSVEFDVQTNRSFTMMVSGVIPEPPLPTLPAPPPAGGGGFGGAPTGIYKSVTYLNADMLTARDCGHALTNAALSAKPGTLIAVGPGLYWIPTNKTSLSMPGVDYYFYPGAVVTMGTPGDTQEYAMFGDGLVFAALTNRVFGYGQFFVSNKLGRVFLQNEPESVTIFECDVAHVLGDAGCIEQGGGELYYTARRYTRADKYDGFLGSSAVIKRLSFTTPLLYAGDTLIESGTGVKNVGDAVFNVGHAETLIGGLPSGQALSIGSNMVMNISSIRLTYGCSITGTEVGDDPGSGVLQNCIITAAKSATVSPISKLPGFTTSFTLRNCKIVGPDNVDPMDIDPMSGQLTVENCTILCGPGSTNWVRASAGARTILLQGALVTNKTNHTSVTVIGSDYRTNVMTRL